MNIEDNISRAIQGYQVAVVTPTEIISPQVQTLVGQYRHFAKASAENILELARTLVLAKQKLVGEDLDVFCREVGLDRKSSTYRKLTAIGEKVPRFAPHTEQMPTAWTTVYKLAMLSDDEFNAVTSDSQFSPFITAKKITAIVKPEQPNSTNAVPKAQSKSANKFSITLDMNALDIPAVRELYQNIEKLRKDRGFKIVLSEDCKMILDHARAASSDGSFQMEQAA